MLQGRDSERATVAALLDEARAGRGGALVLRGQPGVGKSALLADTVARAKGMTVLRTHGIESESPLAFAALQRLLRPVMPCADRLPTPQAQALGEFLRRARRRVDARVHLRAALQTFEDLGAEPLAERARQELRASGETARRLDRSAAPALTPQESQIVRLVRQGLSNRDVAAQLFLSPRTVDFHLGNVFAKLGLTSRTELAAHPLP